MSQLTDAQIAASVRLLGKYSVAIVIGRAAGGGWAGSAGEVSDRPPIIKETLEEAIWSMAQEILTDMKEGLGT